MLFKDSTFIVIVLMLESTLVVVMTVRGGGNDGIFGKDKGKLWLR